MLKRFFDIIFSTLGLVMLLPIFLVVAVLILLLDGRPVFFLQRRVGRHGKFFKIIKFRTMTEKQKNNAAQITVGNDVRVYPLGRVLRKSKVDELPQLFNVLFGQMSFVGPRPEVEKYVQMYSEEQKKVLDWRPGITDPASILFRNESEILGNSDDPEKMYVEELMPQKIQVNLNYAVKSNLLRDMRVILVTLLAICQPNKTWKF